MAAATGVPGSRSSAVQVDDSNHDGRPDVWRFYDPHGALTAIEIDSNFDGRSDRNEYYQEGAVARIELDRDFDGRVDVVQEFDTSSHDRVRSIVDTDADGVADLLVLFQHDRPVLTTWLTPTPADPRRESTLRAATVLTPLVDPFRTQATVRALGCPAGAANVAVGAPGVGLPMRPFEGIAVAIQSPVNRPRPAPCVESIVASARSTRAPPSASIV